MSPELCKKCLKSLFAMPNKGRIDSTSTNEVTVINTILNKNLTVTDEGNAIRRRIELELQLDESPKDNLEIMKIMKNAPDISSRFSFFKWNPVGNIL